MDNQIKQGRFSPGKKGISAVPWGEIGEKRGVMVFYRGEMGERGETC